jgi:hypothetical protein
MADLNHNESLTIIGVLLLAVFGIGAFELGVVKMSDYSSALAYFVVFGIPTLFVWGFRGRLETYVPSKEKKEVPRLLRRFKRASDVGIGEYISRVFAGLWGGIILIVVGVQIWAVLPRETPILILLTPTTCVVGGILVAGFASLSIIAQFYKWPPESGAGLQMPSEAKNVEELISGLRDLISEPPSKFQTSGDSYVGKIPLRERATRYVLLEVKAEALLGNGFDPKRFRINPDLLDPTEKSWAYITGLARDLLALAETCRARSEPTKTPESGPTVRISTGRETATISPLPNITIPAVIPIDPDAMKRWLSKMKVALDNLSDVAITARPKPQTELMFLDRFRYALVDLPYPKQHEWTLETRQMVSQILDLIATFMFKFTDYEQRCLDWLNIIVARDDERTNSDVKTRFLPRITSLMGIGDNPRFAENIDLIHLHQVLNDYQTAPMLSLAKEMMDSTAWSDNRFDKMHRNLEFTLMAHGNAEGVREILRYLFGQLKTSEDSHDFERHRRAKALYDVAESSLR